MLGLTARFSGRSSTVTHARVVCNRLARQPTLSQRRAGNGAKSWPQPIVATYYFDASSHSALTLRTVLNAHQQPGQVLGKSDQKLMIDSVNTLVAATCPQGHMDSESQAYFELLLNMHLSGLEPEELKTLARALKSAGYDSVSDRAAVQHDIYDEFGFVSGGPQDIATLPTDWHHLLDDAIEHAASIARRPLAGKPPGAAEARAARQCLLDAALSWPVGERSMKDLVEIARQLSEAIGLSPAPRVGHSAKLKQSGSMVDWKNESLLIDLKAFGALADETDGKLFTEVLRDLIELLVARKMFGDNVHPSRLCAADRTRLQKAMNEIQSAPPAPPGVLLQQSAARVLAHAGTMGKVQVLPTIGVALGHAWIGSSLSVVPDKAKPPVGIGTRFMHPGFQLEPSDCQVMQWPIRWLDANENAKLFTDEHAWQITVPVHRDRLEQAATEVAGEWKAQAKPYRFTGSTPGMHSTGCRASVLLAIEKGMDDDARALFAYFNAGLADPESPTELAVRMNQFMRWLPSIAANAGH